MSVAESLGYRSPVSMLLRFFRRSRDQWKTKCKEAKRDNKSLKYRLAKMKESRDRWKVRARGFLKDSEEAAVLVEEPKNLAEPRCRGRRRRATRSGTARAG
jgi:hypothetical protein